jgi:hypothetical protein
MAYLKRRGNENDQLMAWQYQWRISEIGQRNVAKM